MRYRTHEKGFTLVEMVVAVGLFAIVMMVCVEVLLSLVNANRKAQALQSVMNNLNIALDGMVRPMREGSTFRCSSSGVTANEANPLQVQDCPSTTDDPSNHYVFAFEPFGNTNKDAPTVYSYDPSTKRIYKSKQGATAIPITAPEVTIDSMQFYVVGTTHGDDGVQPKVIIVIRGSAGVPGSKSATTFHIQATAVQRVLDL